MKDKDAAHVLLSVLFFLTSLFISIIQIAPLKSQSINKTEVPQQKIKNYITYKQQFMGPISPLMFFLWSLQKTRAYTTVHTIAVVNKSVQANPDKDTSFILHFFPFIPPAAVKENAINSKQMQQLHFEDDKYFKSTEDVFKLRSRLPPLVRWLSSSRLLEIINDSCYPSCRSFLWVLNGIKLVCVRGRARSSVKWMPKM